PAALLPMPAPTGIRPAEPGRKPLAAAPAARPQPAAPPIREVRGGRYRVQLASLRTPDEARTEWQRLKRRYPDLLGRLTADAVRADLGQRGVWYRVEAGGFANAATARRLCRELKGRHLGCSIVR
ncbi:MAG: SPOR domain-containing protein, partial [Stellaceae bacterium]